MGASVLLRLILISYIRRQGIPISQGNSNINLQGAINSHSPDRYSAFLIRSERTATRLHSIEPSNRTLRRLVDCAKMSAFAFKQINDSARPVCVVQGVCQSLCVLHGTHFFQTGFPHTRKRTSQFSPLFEFIDQRYQIGQRISFLEQRLSSFNRIRPFCLGDYCAGRRLSSVSERPSCQQKIQVLICSFRQPRLGKASRSGEIASPSCQDTWKACCNADQHSSRHPPGSFEHGLKQNVQLPRLA